MARFLDLHVSIAKAIPSLLEPAIRRVGRCGRGRVSIAKAIPSLLELCTLSAKLERLFGFNRESDSVTVGAMSDDSKDKQRAGFNRESDSVTVGAC